MNNVFLVYTPYHLLIAIIKTLLAKRVGVDELIVCDPTAIHSKLAQSAGIIFKKIIQVKHGKTFSYFNVLLWRNRISKHLRFSSHILKKIIGFDESYFKDKDVFIFNDYTAIGYLFNISGITYNLIEDGLNCFQYPLSSFTKSRCKFSHIWESVLGVSWLPFGPSRFTKSVEVNDKSNLHIKHPNIIVSNREQMFKKLNSSEINTIAKIFGYQPLNYPIENNSTLLLTQPLSEDHLIKHAKKIELYKQLVSKYSIGTLYIKKHPRERENYLDIFPNAIILENSNIPFEIFMLKEKIHFKRALSIYSTAMDAIFCADEKIQMGEKWIF